MLDLILAAALFVFVLGARIAHVISRRRARESGVDALEQEPRSIRGDFGAATYWAIGPIARQLVRDGVSANVVTGAAVVFGAAAGMAFAAGHFGIGAWFAASSALCDALDGLVARGSGAATPAGEALDESVDRYTEFFVLAGLAFYFRTNAWMLAIVLLSLQGSYMLGYVETKTKRDPLDRARAWMGRPGRGALFVAGAVLSTFIAPFGVARWIALLPLLAALFVDAVGANASAAYRLLRAVAVLGKQKPAPTATLASAPSLPADERPTRRDAIAVHRVRTIG